MSAGWYGHPDRLDPTVQTYPWLDTLENLRASQAAFVSDSIFSESLDQSLSGDLCPEVSMRSWTGVVCGVLWASKLYGSKEAEASTHIDIGT
jgi:hypothetical protein